ncbi:DUF2300 domain-containing protein [Ideonella azotifigens]|uniref:DUF2300 domain-containing protein n=1 Tax=Ideonella azotifigens TaxID=513160 RepID=A0ABN1KB34_9BURK|nr:DUF2300 domain-containing protein [Ideonella azotifigens]MCD2344104.1 DUF2300 domain-containing protein [Ideonella azotifigens]
MAAQRHWQTIAGGVLAMTAACACAAPPSTVLAWRVPGGELRSNAPLPATVPLGSTWKLFVYSYLISIGAQEPVYRCERAQREAGDEYCCDPGESIGRDAALQRSCGAYFAPRRLGLTDANWRRFWSELDAPAWLLSLPALQPATTVPPERLLDALQHVPAAGRVAAREALLPNTLREPALLAAVGSSPRFKTWSWFDGQQERWGGAAGWLADGAPFWLGAPGTGQKVLAREAGRLAEAWQASGQLEGAPEAVALQAQPCVDVRLFARYPLASVKRQGQPAAPGPLTAGARYALRFANGQSLEIPGQPELLLGAGPQLQARLPLEDYVARVVDREGDARETAAARALAVAARSWLRQNAATPGGCLQVADDSRAQRVSPRPPSDAARAAAAFTAGLVLDGAPVHYRSDGAAPQLMGWREAVAASRAGNSFEALLRNAYPAAVLAGWHDDSDCAPLPLAAAWLGERSARWGRVLRAEAGYEPPDALPQVCELGQGVPHADPRRGRIFLREWQSREGRVTLIHEYLHLAFRRHPRGQDETYIERLAQQLADV